MADHKQGWAGVFTKLRAWLRRRPKPSRSYEGFTKPAGAGPLQGMSWREFELLAGDAFRLQGYSVSKLGTKEQDEGADLVLRRGGKTLLVAYRQWNVASVGAEAVQDLRATVAEQRADAGLLLTLGRFDAPAQAAAPGSGVDLVDGARLAPLIQHAQATRNSETAPAPLRF